MYYWNLKLLIYLIIVNTEVILPQSMVTLADLGHPGSALWFYSS
jgi:hypothetical protein